MPKCKNCGADVKEGDLFCGFCGKRIETAPEIPAQPIPQPQLQQAAYAKEAMAQAQQPQAAQAAQPVMLKKVMLRNPQGKLKKVDMRYCKWIALFGFLFCLYKRDFKMGAILFVLAYIGAFISSFIFGVLLYEYDTDGRIAFQAAGIGSVTVHIIMGYKYNPTYIKGLLAEGWQPLGPNDAYTLRQKGIMS